MTTDNENVTSPGISFSGGAENEYIKEFARLRELAEKSGGTEEQIREDIRAIRPMADVFPERKPGPGIPMQSEFLPENPSWEPAPEGTAPGTLFEAPAGEREAAEEKPELRGFRKVFSENTFLSVASLLTGGVSALWSVLYVVVLSIRTSMFSTAQSSMAARGQAAYHLTFETPWLAVLKIFAYFIPVLAILFAAALKVADNKEQRFGKKMAVAVLCVIVLAGVLAGFDVGFAHLLF